MDLGSIWLIKHSIWYSVMARAIHAQEAIGSFLDTNTLTPVKRLSYANRLQQDPFRFYPVHLWCDIFAGTRFNQLVFVNPHILSVVTLPPWELSGLFPNHPTRSYRQISRDPFSIYDWVRSQCIAKYVTYLVFQKIPYEFFPSNFISW